MEAVAKLGIGVGAIWVVIQIIALLVGLPAGALISASLDDGPSPTPQPPRIAYVEDRPNWQDFLPTMLSSRLGGTVDVYGDCGTLIAALTGNIELNYAVYLVDNGLPDTTGPVCIEQIRALRPTARFLGIPGDDEPKDEFQRVGTEIITKETISKDGIQPLVDALQHLLH